MPRKEQLPRTQKIPTRQQPPSTTPHEVSSSAPRGGFRLEILSPRDMLAMQRTMGNRSVARMLSPTAHRIQLSSQSSIQRITDDQGTEHISGEYGDKAQIFGHFKRWYGQTYPNASIGDLSLEQYQEILPTFYTTLQGTHTDQHRAMHIPQVPHAHNSDKVRRRFQFAADAIQFATSLFPSGPGNRKSAIRASHGNAMARESVMRRGQYWDDIEGAIPNEAVTALKAEICGGGNCNEFAEVVWVYLQKHAIGEMLNLVINLKPQHALIVLGDMKEDPSDELVAVDAWPEAPVPLLWKEHFANNSGASPSKSEVADGTDLMEEYRGQVKLYARNQQDAEEIMVEQYENIDYYGPSIMDDFPGGRKPPTRQKTARPKKQKEKAKSEQPRKKSRKLSDKKKKEERPRKRLRKLSETRNVEDEQAPLDTNVEDEIMLDEKNVKNSPRKRLRKLSEKQNVEEKQAPPETTIEEDIIFDEDD